LSQTTINKDISYRPQSRDLNGWLTILTAG